MKCCLIKFSPAHHDIWKPHIHSSLLLNLYQTGPFWPEFSFSLSQTLLSSPPAAAVSASGSGNNISGPPANGLYRSMPQPQPQPQQQQQAPPPSSGLPSSSFYGSGSVPNTSQSSSLFSHTSAAPPPPSSSLGFSSTSGSLGVGLGSALGAFGSSGQWLDLT